MTERLKCFQIFSFVPLFFQQKEMVLQPCHFAYGYKFDSVISPESINLNKINSKVSISFKFKICYIYEAYTTDL